MKFGGLSLISVLIVVAGALGSWIICSCIGAYRMAYQLCHPSRREHRLGIMDVEGVSCFEFWTEDGVVLKGIDVKPKGTVEGTVLLCHHLGGCKEVAVNTMRPLLEMGYQLISFDFRNHGESGNDNRIRFSLIEDFDAFYKYAIERACSHNIGIVGFSMGCTVALHGLCKYEEIKVALIDSGPLLDVDHYFRYVMSQRNIKNKVTIEFFVWFYIHIGGFNEMRYYTLRCLKDIAHDDRRKCVGIQFIHGQRDNIIPLSDAIKAHREVKEISSIWIVEKSRHLTNCMVDPKKYIEVTLQLLKRLS